MRRFSRPSSKSHICLRYSACLIGALTLQANAQYFETFGIIPGSRDYGYAYGISADGEKVVGGLNPPLPGPYGWGFEWSRDEGVHEYPRPQDILEMNAYAVSPDGGSTIGWAVFLTEDGSYYQWGIHIRSNGNLEALPNLPGYFDSYAVAASLNASSIVGAAIRGYPPDYEVLSEAVVWTASGVTSLGFLGGSRAHTSFANDISSDGQVVVGWSQIDHRWGDKSAFRWTSATGMIRLDSLINSSSLWDEANAVSSDGRFAVGESDTRMPNGLTQENPVRWDEEGHVLGLGLPEGYVSGAAMAISADGSVIAGVADTGPAPSDVFLWWPATERSPMRLHDYLAENGVFIPSGLRLHRVWAISDDGLVFAGSVETINEYPIPFVASVRRACPADFNGDGGVDGSDVAAFYQAWEPADPSADVNRDGGVDGADVEAFFVPWEAGGC